MGAGNNSSLSHWAQLEEARDFLLKKCSKFPKFPKVAVVLGSGLSGLLDQLEVWFDTSYGDIPHFKGATVEGHAGRLVVGSLGGTPVACMQGRLHYYEGYTSNEVVFPFRLLAFCGVEAFVLTNAAGSLHADMKPLDLMLITDHINLMGINPLIGPNEKRFGERFPDMTEVYDKELTDIIRKAAKAQKVPMREGVYVALHGPCFETPAEIRMYQKLGGDSVGMSTAPEAIALRHMGKRVAGISFITNFATGIVDEPPKHSEVLENARKGYAVFSKVMVESLREIGKTYVKV